MNETTIAIITFLISAAIFIPVGMYLRKKSAESKIKGAENEAERILSNAKKEAEAIEEESAAEEIAEMIANMFKVLAFKYFFISELPYPTTKGVTPLNHALLDFSIH